MRAIDDAAKGSWKSEVTDVNGASISVSFAIFYN